MSNHTLLYRTRDFDLNQKTGTIWLGDILMIKISSPETKRMRRINKGKANKEEYKNQFCVVAKGTELHSRRQ